MSLLAREQNLDYATDLLDKAIKLEPSNNLYYFNKGLVLAALKKYGEAIKFYEKSISLIDVNEKNDLVSIANRKLAYLYMKHEENYQKAIFHYEALNAIEDLNSADQ